MKIYWIVIVLVALVLSNLVWFIQSHRISTKIAYHATHLCELERLLTLKSVVPLGTKLDKVDQLCNTQGRLDCHKKGDVFFVDFKNTVGCPPSGRPYCGFRIKIKHSHVDAIRSAYPCH